MRFADVGTLEIHGGVGTSGRNIGSSRDRPSRDIVLVLEHAEPLTRPIDLALTLKAFGLRLREAHLALDRIAADETDKPNLVNSDRSTTIARRAELGIEAR